METTSSLSDEVQLMQELLKNLCNELNKKPSTKGLYEKYLMKLLLEREKVTYKIKKQEYANKTNDIICIETINTVIESLLETYLQF